MEFSSQKHTHDETLKDECLLPQFYPLPLFVLHAFAAFASTLRNLFTSCFQLKAVEVFTKAETGFINNLPPDKNCLLYSTLHSLLTPLSIHVDHFIVYPMDAFGHNSFSMDMADALSKLLFDWLSMNIILHGAYPTY